MNKPKNYSIEDVYNATLISLSFDFYSAKNTKILLNDLQEILISSVSLSYQYNTAITDNFILFKDYESSNPLYILKTPFLHYNDFKQKLIVLLNYINNTASFNEFTQLKVDLQFNHRLLKTNNTISNMNICKMILAFDENLLYDKYPNMINSPYCISIKNIIPKHTFSSNININYLSQHTILPKNKYYGINFNKQTFGILSFNYIGGEYASNIENILDSLKYYILKTYTILNDDEYNQFEIEEYKKIQNKYDFVTRGFNDCNIFIKENPDIKIKINLNNDIQLIKTYWPQIRKHIFELYMIGNMRKGIINLDTEINKIQINNCSIKDCNLDGIDIFNSSIEGIIKNCQIWNTKINNSIVINCNLNDRNVLDKCRCKNVIVNKGNTIKNSYVLNKLHKFEGISYNSILKNCSVSKFAKADEYTIIVNNKSFDPDVSLGLEVKDIKDYNWLKKIN